MFNRFVCCGRMIEPTAKFFNKITIAHDKGKLAARQGRKAVSLGERGTLKLLVCGDSLVAEGDLKRPGIRSITAERWKPCLSLTRMRSLSQRSVALPLQSFFANPGRNHPLAQAPRRSVIPLLIIFLQTFHSTAF